MKFKNFSIKTDPLIVGLSDTLVSMLDMARDVYGNPIVITSGKRSKKQNADVGGVKDSSHIDGIGVDISIPKIFELKYKLIFSLCVSGFRRIGVYANHIHVDIDDRKLSPAFWYSEKS